MRSSMIAVMVLVGQLRSAEADGWHVDAELRPDLAIHPLRLGAGVQRGALDVTAIVDPLGAIDGQQDMDVIVGIAVRRGWKVTAGVRATAIGLMSGQAWHDRGLVGAMAPLAPWARLAGVRGCGGERGRRRARRGGDDVVAALVRELRPRHVREVQLWALR